MEITKEVWKKKQDLYRHLLSKELRNREEKSLLKGKHSSRQAQSTNYNI